MTIENVDMTKLHVELAFSQAGASIHVYRDAHDGTPAGGIVSCGSQETGPVALLRAWGTGNLDEETYADGLATCSEDRVWHFNAAPTVAVDWTDVVSRAIDEGDWTELYDQLRDEIEGQWEECERREAARLLETDEPRDYDLRDDSHGEATIRCRPSEIEEEVRDWVAEGEYGDYARTIWIDGRWHCELTGEEGSVTVALDPEEPECPETDGHAWATPYELLLELIGRESSTAAIEVVDRAHLVEDLDTDSPELRAAQEHHKVDGLAPVGSCWETVEEEEGEENDIEELAR